MGWFWGASSQPTTSSTSSNNPVPRAPNPPPSPPPQKENDPAADPEVQKFLALFQTDLVSDPRTASSSTAPRSSAPATQQQQPPSSATPPSSPPDSVESSSVSSWLSWRSAPAAAAPSTTTRTATRRSNPSGEGPQTPQGGHEQGDDNNDDEEPIGDACLPRTMSCRQAFDLAFECQGPSGQLRSVYRYGGVRECSDLWADFWFCMRVKGYGAPAREHAIREHYRDKERRKYAGKPSSEDVWESRPRKVEPGAAFSEPLEMAPALDHKEWNEADMERRRRIREDLGYYKPAEAAKEAPGT